MKIACVNSDPGIAPGRRKGAAVHVAAMRGAFAGTGAEVVAIDAADDGETSRALAQAIAAGGIDLVYERYALARYAAASIALRHGIPHVLEINAPLAEEELRWREPGASIDPVRERAQLESAALVLAVSSEVARYAIARGAAPERTRVTPNAVDPGLFRPRDPRDSLRSSLFPADAFVLGFHGRLRPWHNLGLLAEAFAILVRRGLPVHFLALGEGPFEAVLGELVPADRRVIVPWVPHAEVPRYVACFDVLPLTYAPGESCYFSPLKLLEAMAAGAVPVVPDLGDLAAAVGDGSCGVIVPAGDAQALADAVASLAQDGDRFRRLARAARAHAEGRTWERIAREVLDLVVGGRTR